MKIRIDDGKHVIRIIVPNAVALSCLFIRMVSKAAPSEAVPLPAAKIALLSRELRRFAREHPRRVLVDIDSSNGEKVKITL